MFRSVLTSRLVTACLTGVVASVALVQLLRRRRREHARGKGLFDGVRASPLVELRSLSVLTGCRILAKCEHLQPGGSVKDRAAHFLVAAAERSGQLKPGGTVVQGTGGNTGVSLAFICNAKGYKCHFTYPENISQEKKDFMKLLGAERTECPCVPLSDSRHYVNQAREITKTTPGAVWPDQFENLANSQAHFETTGPEIWRQAGGVDGFVCAAGTGGTISGCVRYLKSVSKGVAAYLIDPTGSGLKSFVETGCFASQGSCYMDGIGISRETSNFGACKDLIDGAFRGNDREAVEMCHFLVRNEGIWVGPSAALNVVGAVKLARRLGPGKTVATILCDGGERYLNTTYSEEWLKDKGLVPQCSGLDLSFIQADD